MILYTMIVRTRDGLPFVASTDVGIRIQNQVQHLRQHLKVLAKQVGSLPDRCSLAVQQHLIHVISSLGVSFMVLSEESYPPVLAFSFLDEIQREFITIYDTRQTSAVTRPYAFIEFDSFIQKTRQRYNSPRSLTTRINISDLSTEIKLRPPTQLTLSDLQIHEGSTTSTMPSSGPLKFSPSFLPPLPMLPWFGVVSLVLSIMCALFCVFRGLTSLGGSRLQEIDGTEPTHGVIFLLEALIGCFQMYILINNTWIRKELNWLALSLSMVSNYYLSDVQNVWQTLAHFGIAILSAMCTTIHRPKSKNPNYNV